MANEVSKSVKELLKQQHLEIGIKDCGHHLIIIVDISGSMNERQKNNIIKLQQLQSILTTFYRTCGFKLHLVSFSDLAQLSSGEFLDDVLTLTSHGSTIMSEGLKAVLLLYDTLHEPSRAILLSDGQITEEEDAVWSQVYLFTSKSTPMIIDTIGFGIGVNERLMKEIANKTGGTYYHADNIGGVLGKLLDIEVRSYLEWKK